VQHADGDQVDAVRAGSPSIAGSGQPARRPSAAALLVAGVLFVTGTGTAALTAGLSDPAAGPAQLGRPSSAAGGGREGAAPSSSATGATVDEPAGVGAAATGAAAAGDEAPENAPDPSVALARAAAVQPLLTARSAAVRSGGRAAWLRLLDPEATAFRARQGAVLDRVRRLAPTAWSYELVGTATAAGTPGVPAFLAHVRLHYRLSADTRDVVREQYLDVVQRSGRWYLAGDGDPRTEPALWDLGELRVWRGRRSLVVGIGLPAGPATDARLRRIAGVTDAAAGDVDAVWGVGWPRAAVVVVPRTRALMARALGRADDDGLDQVAAVTSGELDRASEAGPPSSAPLPRPGGVADRVVLNPDPFARLTEVGRRVVLTHELTHVATRASARPAVPLWVEEGFANYVAYRTSRLAPAVVASDVLPAVRSGTAPEHLPVAADFDPSSGPIAAAYADAWLAFDLMSRGGASRPLDFYRHAAGRGGGADRSADDLVTAAFRDVLGTTQEQFEANWRAYRAQLAAGTAA